MDKISNIEDILLSLGYSLVDGGEYWRTNALYRGGDNSTALQIYKDSGVWKDYVEETGFLPFSALIEKSKDLVDEDTFKKITEGTSLGAVRQEHLDKKDFIIEEYFDPSILNTLLPHYRFYEEKGISKEILEDLSAGLCTQGQMYQRFVFPIFNQYKKIIGFAGRDMMNKDSRPKWKHVGKKSNWIYPVYSQKQQDLFNKDKNLIIVESIGDLLSIKQNTDQNCLVSFGLDLSPKIISSMLSFSFKKIIIAFNNDSNSTENRGKNAAIKNYLKLLSYFDVDKIKICLPVKNDFGDMNKEDFKVWLSKLSRIEKEDQRQAVISESKKLEKNNKLSKPLLKNLNFIQYD